MPKRIHRDNETNDPDSSETLNGTNLAHAQYIIEIFQERYGIDLIELAKSADGPKTSFSEISYEGTAPYVGLSALDQGYDMQTFQLHKSRISTNLFKTIAERMDEMMSQYGCPHDLKNEEARSRFFSPIFTCLVAQFGSLLQNFPATVMEGQIETRGRIKYVFKAFESIIGLLYIEAKHKNLSRPEILKSIAQVISECDGCDRINATFGITGVPITCIFSHDMKFEYFRFQRLDPKPSFLRGCYPGDPAGYEQGWVLPEPNPPGNPLSFLIQLKFLSETIFDLMMEAYISALNTRRCRARLSRDQYDQAQKFAEDALSKFREAESRCQNGDVVSADVLVNEGFTLLKKSTDAAPDRYKVTSLLTGWDEAKLSKACVLDGG